MTMGQETGNLRNNGGGEWKKDLKKKKKKMCAINLVGTETRYMNKDLKKKIHFLL